MSNPPHTRRNQVKPKILLIGKIVAAQQLWKQLGVNTTVEQIIDTSRDRFRDLCRTDQFASISVIIRTFESTEMTGRFDETLLEFLPSSVRYICHIGAGYESIDVSLCVARGIKVSHTPRINSRSTATNAMWLLLGCLRRIQVPCNALRADRWRGEMELGYDPEGKTLGILGMGEIGTELAKRAVPFGMHIQYHNRTSLSVDKSPKGAQYVSFEQLLRTSDIISVHVPSNPSTHHMIGAQEIQMMKKGAIIINTARGSILDESAVLEALDQDHLFSVGLDVYEKEPNVSESLRHNDKCVLTPHIGPATWETMTAMEALAFDNALTAVVYGSLKTPVPETKEMDERKRP